MEDVEHPTCRQMMQALSAVSFVLETNEEDLLEDNYLAL